jgi:signal transduction histidine kinase
MRAHTNQARANKPAVPNPSTGITGMSLELALLGGVSLVTVVILMAGIINKSEAHAASAAVEAGNVVAIFGALLLVTTATVWQVVRGVKRDANIIRHENAALHHRLLGTESIIKAEPQVLIYWEPGQHLAVVTHTLTTVAGLPESNRDLLRFGQWLELAAAEELKSGLDALFGEGKSFNVIVKTRAGGYLEAEGRTAGGRAVLRMRDVIGHKRDLSRLLNHHQALMHDVRASRAILDSLPSPVWIKGNDGRISWVNSAYRRAVDADSNAEITERQIELLESRQRAAVERGVAQGAPYRERLQLVIGGERKPHELVVLPIQGGQAGAALDITDVEQAQGELDRQSAAYEGTLDKVATAVAIFGPDRRLVYFNDAYQRLWQIDAAWLRTTPIENAVLDRLREDARLPEAVNYREWKAKFLAKVRATPSSEEQWHLPDGRTLQVLAESRADGSITYLFVDQTERFAMESRFNQQIKSQRETLDSLKEGVAVFGTDGRMKFLNAAFATIWNLDDTLADKKPHLDEMIARVSASHGPNETWARIAEAVTHYRDQRAPLEGQMIRADNMMLAYAALPLPDGATLLTFADITDAKRYERTLVERNEALIAADRLKNKFIGHVSYELRTPLQNITGFGEFLSDPMVGPLNPKQREYLSAITTSSNTLMAIINDILVLASIDAGALELELSQVLVGNVIDAAIEGVRDRAVQAKLTLDIGQADDAIAFTADETRVRQVLYNLVSNAVGFSKKGDTIQITAWRQDGMMKFSVEDQGVGIPREQQDRVFERFESRSQGSNHRGAGLGLSIVQSLVDLHGGKVAITSKTGEGTRVVVAFPERGEGVVMPDLKPSLGGPSPLPPVFIPGLNAQAG